MSSGRPLAILAIGLAILILWFAVKFGTIGGGAGAERDTDSFNYWLGVSITALGLFFMILVLIGTFVRPDRFRLG